MEYEDGLKRLLDAMTIASPFNLMFAEIIMNKFHYLNILKKHFKIGALNLAMQYHFQLLSCNYPNHLFKIMEQSFVYNVEAAKADQLTVKNDM